METKSRYEVISELESQKRELIQERDSFMDEVNKREKDLKKLERNKSDQLIGHDRGIEDAKEELETFKKTMNERKETIKELIQSVDDSLKRFEKLQSGK